MICTPWPHFPSGILCLRKTALYLRKRALYFRTRAQYIHAWIMRHGMSLPVVSYVSSKEPYISAKGPYMASISQRHLCLRQRAVYHRKRAQYLYMWNISHGISLPAVCLATRILLLWVLCHLTGFARLVWGKSNVLLQCVVVCCSVLQCGAVCCSVLHCVALCCIVLQCVAVCVLFILMKQYVYCLFLWTPDDDCIYYHSWRNNVIIVFWILSSEYLLVCLATWIIHVCDQTHMRMRHVTRIDMHNGTLVLNIVSCHTYEWVILHSCWILCHVTHMNTHMNESYCSCWILCHVTHMNESYCTHAE